MTSNIYNLIADETATTARDGHIKYRNVSIALVGARIAQGMLNFHPDTVRDINELIASDIKFADTLRKEVAKSKSEAEFRSALESNPGLAAKLAKFPSARRDWKRLAKQLGYNV